MAKSSAEDEDSAAPPAVKDDALKRSFTTADTLDCNPASLDPLDVPDDGGRPRPPRSCLSAKTPRDSLGGGRRPPRGTTVRFDAVEVREYGIVLGDNPSASSGPPIAIGWDFDPEDTSRSDIDTYEAKRTLWEARRHWEDLPIPADVREGILLDAGFSPDEIVSAEKMGLEEKKRRARSLRRKSLDPVFLWAEKARRGIDRSMCRATKDSRVPRD